MTNQNKEIVRDLKKALENAKECWGVSGQLGELEGRIWRIIRDLENADGKGISYGEEANGEPSGL